MATQKPTSPEHIIDLLITKKLTLLDAGYAKFTISRKKNLIIEGDKCLGSGCFDKFQIFIEEDLDFNVSKETLKHEITHIFLEVVGLGEALGDDWKPSFDKETNESLTDKMTKAFCIFAHLNQELFKLLYVES